MLKGIENIVKRRTRVKFRIISTWKVNEVLTSLDSSVAVNLRWGHQRPWHNIRNGSPDDIAKIISKEFIRNKSDYEIRITHEVYSGATNKHYIDLYRVKMQEGDEKPTRVLPVEYGAEINYEIKEE